MSDAILEVNPTTGFYDFSLDENGDIATADFFDTSILYSIFGEKRASPDEVVKPEFRRGWIGNGDFENGSKIWLLYQARLTRSVLNRLADEIKKSLEWLVTDEYAVSIDSANVAISNQNVVLELTIRYSLDKIDRKFYTLWQNTGRT